MPQLLLHGGHLFCHGLTPASPYAPLYAALVCGVNLPDGFAKQLFVDTGLIHILVVSGAHLVFVERHLRRCPSPLITFGLVLYCWLTDWGAPVTRALSARLTRRWTSPRGWSPLAGEFLATLLTLVVYPPWLFSRSFLMSWLCVLALTTPGPRGRARFLFESARVYVFLYPYSLAAPLTIAWNCLIAPAVGRVMFPAALLAMLCPPVTPAVDLLWRALLWTLAHGPRFAPDGALIRLEWIWWLPWAVHSTLLYGEWTWRRARAFSSS